MGGRILAWMIGLAPVSLFMITWSQNLDLGQRLARSYAIPVVLVEIFVILAAIRVAGRFQSAPTLVWTSFLALMMVAWATAATAPYPAVAILRTALWSIHLLYAFALARLAASGKISPTDLANAFLAGFLICTVMLLVFVAYVTRHDFNMTTDLPAFSNIRWYGYYAAAAVGLAAWGFSDGRKYHLLVAAIAFAMSFWTGSRGAVWASLAGLAVAVLVFPELRKIEAWLRIAATFVAGLVLAVGLGMALPIDGGGPARMTSLGGNGRIELWMGTFENILRRPVFGWGEAQIAYFSGRPLQVSQAHNVILQVVHAWGVVGAILLAVPSAWLAWLLLGRASHRTLPLACAITVLAAFSLIDGTLYHVHSVSIFVACVAVMAASGSRSGPVGLGPRRPTSDAMDARTLRPGMTRDGETGPFALPRLRSGV